MYEKLPGWPDEVSIGDMVKMGKIQTSEIISEQLKKETGCHSKMPSGQRNAFRTEAAKLYFGSNLEKCQKRTAFRNGRKVAQILLLTELLFISVAFLKQI